MKSRMTRSLFFWSSITCVPKSQPLPDRSFSWSIVHVWISLLPSSIVSKDRQYVPQGWGPFFSGPSTFIPTPHSYLMTVHFRAWISGRSTLVDMPRTIFDLKYMRMIGMHFQVKCNFQEFFHLLWAIWYFSTVKCKAISPDINEKSLSFD